MVIPMSKRVSIAKGEKGICFYCRKPIHRGGIVQKGRHYHKACLDKMKRFFKPRKNPWAKK